MISHIKSEIYKICLGRKNVEIIKFQHFFDEQEERMLINVAIKVVLCK